MMRPRSHQRGRQNCSPLLDVRGGPTTGFINSLTQPHAQRRILHAQRVEAQTRNGSDVAHTCFSFPTIDSQEMILRLAKHFATHPTPVVRLTFSSSVNCLTKA